MCFELVWKESATLVVPTAIDQTAGSVSITLKQTMTTPVYVSQLWGTVVISNIESNFSLQIIHSWKNWFISWVSAYVSNCPLPFRVVLKKQRGWRKAHTFHFCLSWDHLNVTDMLVRSWRIPSDFCIFCSFLLRTFSCIDTSHKLMKTDLFKKIPETLMLKIAPVLERSHIIFCCKSSLEAGGSFF